MTADASWVQCCFCGNTIVVATPDPIAFTVHIDEDEEQTLFCHYRCLRRLVDSSVPLFPFEAK